MMNLPACMALILFSLTACTSSVPITQIPANTRFDPRPYVEVQHPEWAQDAVIYQINTRQFTPEGTFRAAQEELPRLKRLGVDILWLMPVHPIGKVNRKGPLGSPYSVQDYYGVNPEFGSIEDLKSFIDAAHQQGFHVILDWVANHSSWDNQLVAEHPDWYDRNWNGEFHPTPWTDWADIIDLDYSQPGLREYMTGALKFWVAEMGVDGFRCDVAGFVPLDFWETARAELETIKPVFMLAEWEERDLHARAFDASYGWKWKETAQKIASGEANAGAMTFYLQHHIAAWPHDGYRMLYTENHDQNAWEGTTGSLYGDSYKLVLTMSFVTEGIPLIHNGQEVGNQVALDFFDKDPIIWGDGDHADGVFIRRLIEIRKQNKALWNGKAGGRIVPVVTDAPDQIVSFARERDGNKVIILANFSPNPVTFTLRDGPVSGSYTEAFSNRAWSIDLTENARIGLDAWGVLVLQKNEKD